MTRISKNFTLDEFKVSSSYPEIAKAMVIPKATVVNIGHGVNQVLQPWRDAHPGVRLRITSGYRSVILNDRVDGAPGSNHMIGAAADVVSPDMRSEDIFLRFIELRLPIRELFFYIIDGIVHVSWSTPDRSRYKRSIRILRE